MSVDVPDLSEIEDLAIIDPAGYFAVVDEYISSKYGSFENFQKKKKTKGKFCGFKIAGMIKCPCCEKTKNTVYCIKCYKRGNHENHNPTLVIGNGICDCGDCSMLKAGCFCPKHSGCHDKPDLNLLDRDEIKLFHTAFAKAVELLQLSFNDFPDEDFTHVLKFVLKYCSINDGIIRIFVLNFQNVDFLRLLKNISLRNKILDFDKLMEKLGRDEVMINNVVPKIIPIIPNLINDENHHFTLCYRVFLFNAVLLLERNSIDWVETFLQIESRFFNGNYSTRSLFSIIDHYSRFFLKKAFQIDCQVSNVKRYLEGMAKNYLIYEGDLNYADNDIEKNIKIFSATVFNMRVYRNFTEKHYNTAIFDTYVEWLLKDGSDSRDVLASKDKKSLSFDLLHQLLFVNIIHSPSIKRSIDYLVSKYNKGVSKDKEIDRDELCLRMIDVPMKRFIEYYRANFRKKGMSLKCIINTVFVSRHRGDFGLLQIGAGMIGDERKFVEHLYQNTMEEGVFSEYNSELFLFLLTSVSLHRSILSEDHTKSLVEMFSLWLLLEDRNLRRCQKDDIPFTVKRFNEQEIVNEFKKYYSVRSVVGINGKEEELLHLKETANVSIFCPGVDHFYLKALFEGKRKRNEVKEEIVSMEGENGDPIELSLMRYLRNPSKEMNSLMIESLKRKMDGGKTDMINYEITTQILQIIQQLNQSQNSDEAPKQFNIEYTNFHSLIENIPSDLNIFNTTFTFRYGTQTKTKTLKDILMSIPNGSLVAEKLGLIPITPRKVPESPSPSKGIAKPMDTNVCSICGKPGSESNPLIYLMNNCVSFQVSSITNSHIGPVIISSVCPHQLHIGCLRPNKDGLIHCKHCGMNFDSPIQKLDCDFVSFTKQYMALYASKVSRTIVVTTINILSDAISILETRQRINKTCLNDPMNFELIFNLTARAWCLAQSYIDPSKARDRLDRLIIDFVNSQLPLESIDKMIERNSRGLDGSEKNVYMRRALIFKTILKERRNDKAGSYEIKWDEILSEYSKEGIPEIGVCLGRNFVDNLFSPSLFVENIPDIAMDVITGQIYTTDEDSLIFVKEMNFQILSVKQISKAVPNLSIIAIMLNGSNIGNIVEITEKKVEKLNISVYENLLGLNAVCTSEEPMILSKKKFEKLIDIILSGQITKYIN